MRTFNTFFCLSLLAFFCYSCDNSDDPDTPDEPPVVGDQPFESNLSLDTWESFEIYKNPKGWETSNPGTSFLGIINATEETDDVVSGSAVRLETATIGITGIASSTIYTGEFELDLSDPANSAKLGLEFQKRPKNISFHYKYTPGDVYQQFTGAVGTEIPGVDSCLVYMYLQKREGNAIERIGTAAMQNSDTVTEWTAKTLTVQYGEIANPEAGFKLRPEETGWADADTTPTHIIIVFASSSAGDYFRGAIGSLMYVDEIAIEY